MSSAMSSVMSSAMLRREFAPTTPGACGTGTMTWVNTFTRYYDIIAPAIRVIA
jgi:hypothetical protein